MPEPKQLSLDCLNQTTIDEFANPSGYKGLYAFHKYWGKKPTECIAFLIERLSKPGDIVVDPFLGFGLIGREAVIRERRFIGCDINPISTELGTFLLQPPVYDEFAQAYRRLERAVRSEIDESYRLKDGRVGTHFLWEEDKLKSVWMYAQQGRLREQAAPTHYDFKKSNRWIGYYPENLRLLTLFDNSRINTRKGMDWPDIFSGRALRNMDLLIHHIRKESHAVRRGLELVLTAASGQMSKMVFAIQKRGKTSGRVSTRTEVGSWVIGYWRPKVHFEVNVWNCYSNKATRLLKALRDLPSAELAVGVCTPEEVVSSGGTASIVTSDAINVLRQLPDSSIHLVVSDPPHSDRIPYLELSEMWNALLGRSSDYRAEIVVSNAKERRKEKGVYSSKMYEFFSTLQAKLAPGAYAAILFNARDRSSWSGFSGNRLTSDLLYVGCVPMAYSAGSVVQDTRTGGLKYDYVLIYRKTGISGGMGQCISDDLRSLPGWSMSFPHM